MINGYIRTQTLPLAFSENVLRSIDRTCLFTATEPVQDGEKSVFGINSSSSGTGSRPMLFVREVFAIVRENVSEWRLVGRSVLGS
jgi:hypothetical protein